MAEDKFPWNTAILLGAVALGGYLLYKYLAKPIADVTGAVGGAVGQLDKPVITIPDALPGVPNTPTPINYAFPPSGIPGFIDFIKTPTGVLPGVNPKTPTSGQLVQKSTPSTAAFLFPPIGIIEASQKLPTLINETTKAIGNDTLKGIGLVIGAAISGKTITGALAPKVTQAESRTVLPIISKSPTTGKLAPTTILKPLELVAVGKATKAAISTAKTSNTGVIISNYPISPTKTVTVQKAPSIPTSITINKLIRS